MKKLFKRKARGSIDATDDEDAKDESKGPLSKQEKEKWDELMNFVYENRTNEFKNLVAKIKADPKMRIRKILNEKKEHPTTGKPSCLLIEAAMKSNVEIIKVFVDNGCDMNVVNDNDESAVFKACWVNNNELCKVLMQAGADPNIHSKDKRSTLLHAGSQGNRQMMKLLLNVDGTFPHTFDWDKFVNLQSDGNGMSAYLYCCQEGFLDCLKYLVQHQEKFKEKVDVYATRTDGRNGLMLACNENHEHYVDYLLNFCLIDPNRKKEDVLHNRQNRWNVFHYIAFWDNANMVGLVDKYCGGPDDPEAVKLRKEMRNGRSQAGNTPMMLACKHNNLGSVRALITKENANMPDPNGFSALYCAIDKSHERIVKFLCSAVDDYDVVIEQSDLDFCVKKGSTVILCALLMAQIKKHNVDDVDGLAKRGVLDLKIVDKWLAVCEEEGNWSMYGFLTQLKDKGLNAEQKKNRFSYILRLLTMTADDENKNENDDLYGTMRKDMAISNYLSKNCKKETLNDLCNAIEKGIKEQKCSFSDVFYFLFRKHNPDQFNKTLSAITNECLSVKKDNNIKNYTYFKNNFLSSNIWASTYGGANVDDYKVNADDPDGGRPETTFGHFSKDITSNMLKEEQEKLREKLIELEEKHNEDWNSLVTSIRKYNLGEMEELSQMKLVSAYEDKDFMKEEKKGGIQPTKGTNELPIDFESGFYGGNEYDYKIYLTKILIHAQQINPIFQNECKEFFESLNVKCRYSAAPVKTYGRCVTKSKIEYNDRDWPHSAHILDFVRCSVVFENLSDFLSAFNQFYSKFKDDDNIGLLKGCIQGIVRIKNGFSDLPAEMRQNLELKDCGYRDIKCNLITEHNNIRLIGEIQFILKFMLKTKKKQHKIYGLLRKEDLFNHLNRLYYCNDEETEEYLNSMIMNQSINDLAAFFQTMNDNESRYVYNNKDHITDLLQLSNFEKGLKLFKFVMGAVY